MHRKYLGPLIFSTIMCLGMMAVLLMVWMLSSLKDGPGVASYLKPPPVAKIMQPGNGAVIASGQGVILLASVQSEAGLARVDFYVDGVLEQQHSLGDEGAQTLDVAFPWFSSQTGWHKLSVIAYDQTRRASEAAEIQVGVVVDPADVAASDDMNAPPGEAALLEESGEAALEADSGPGEQDQPPGEEEAPADMPVQPGGDQAQPPQGGDPAEPADPGADRGQSAQDANPDAPDQDQGLPELPPQPQDAPPEITRFDVLVDIEAPPDDGEARAIAQLFGSAQDDIGLLALTLVLGEGNHIEICHQQQQCETELAVPIEEAGQYRFILQAMDTSGQASEPSISIVEVLGDPGQPPAVAGHDIDGDWLREHIDWLREDIDWLGVNLDPNQVWEILNIAGEAPDGDAASEHPCAQGDIDCLREGITVEVVSRPDGNLITLTVDQRIEANEGMIMIPDYVKQFTHSSVTSTHFPWPEAAIELNPGDQFTWLDDDVVCSEEYTYAGRIIAYSPLSWRDGSCVDDGIHICLPMAVESQAATSHECANNEFRIVYFMAEEIHGFPFEGVRLTWGLSGNEHLPAADVKIVLVRKETTGGEMIIYEEQFNQGNPAPGEFVLFDGPGAFDCANAGEEYWYLLGVHPIDTPPLGYANGWLAHASIPAPNGFCPPGQ